MTTPADRATTIREVARSCLERRIAGDSRSDQDFIRAHPELLPELAQELRKISLILEARRRARASATAGGDETRVTSSADSADADSGAPDDSRGGRAFPGVPSDSAVIGGYKIIDEVHRGGQGVVYRAVQIATSRTVAVKVMREGPFASPNDRARFEREVQILAQLRHPNIVAIHDSGVTATCHYFVMDYIAGQPLDRFVDERRRGDQRPGAAPFDLGAALRLFALVCEAVNAAHLRGVIHRDLKPGNICVDADGEPHVLDFGLAKYAPDDLTAHGEAMTVTGQFVGSLPWASPEQIEGSQARIDLRTDVYSLGVMLYHVLAGRFPYDVSGGFRDVANNILNTEPPRPSTVRSRDVDPWERRRGSAAWRDASRNRTALDELDTIVLKCLAKDRERRYQSAGELARDVRRFLAGEPIEAKRDSVGYFLRKQLRRYRVPVTVGAAFVAVVLVGFVTSLQFWHAAALQRDDAILARVAESAQRVRAERARDEAQAARAQAESARAEQAAQTARATAVSGFLQDMLASADPEGVRERDVTVRELLDEASAQMESGSLRDRPEVEAAIRQTVGRTYRSLGRYPAAEPHLQRAVDLATELHGKDSREWADAQFDQAELWYDMGRFEEAQARYEGALRALRQLVGEEDLSVARVLAALAPTLYARGNVAEADAMARQALWIRQQRLPPHHRLIADALAGVARIAWGEGRLDDAESLLRAALEIDEQNGAQRPMTVARGVNNLAELLRDRGKFADAEPLYTRSLAIRRATLGDEHPDVARAMFNLAQLYHDQERYADARELHQAALAMRRKLLPTTHPDIALSLTGLGASQRELGDRAAAIENVCAARDIHLHNGGETSPEYLSAIGNLGALYYETGRLDEAETMMRRSLELLRARQGPNHPNVGERAYNVGLMLKDRGRFDEAEPYMREALRIFRSVFGGSHAAVAGVLQNLSELLMARGRFDEAESLLRECLDMRLNRLATEAWLIGTTRSLLGEALTGQQRFDEAQPLLLEGFAAIDAHPNVPVAWKRRAAERVARLYQGWGKEEFVPIWRNRYPSSQPASNGG